jgi:hypothetical protein
MAGRFPAGGGIGFEGRGFGYGIFNDLIGNLGYSSGNPQGDFIVVRLFHGDCDAAQACQGDALDGCRSHNRIG